MQFESIRAGLISVAQHSMNAFSNCIFIFLCRCCI